MDFWKSEYSEACNIKHTVTRLLGGLADGSWQPGFLVCSKCVCVWQYLTLQQAQQMVQEKQGVHTAARGLPGFIHQSKRSPTKQKLLRRHLHAPQERSIQLKSQKRNWNSLSKSSSLGFLYWLWKGGKGAKLVSYSDSSPPQMPHQCWDFICFSHLTSPQFFISSWRSDLSALYIESVLTGEAHSDPTPD